MVRDTPPVEVVLPLEPYRGTPILWTLAFVGGHMRAFNEPLKAIIKLVLHPSEPGMNE